MTRNILDVFVGTTVPGPGSTPTTARDCSYDRTMTFEQGTTTGANGANRTIGDVAVEAAAPLVGNYSASFPNAAHAYLDEPTTAVDDMTLSFDLRLRERPTVDVRLAVISSLISDVGALVLRANANGTTTVQLRHGNARIGSDSAPLAADTTYRVRLRQVRGNGSNAVLEATVSPAAGPTAAPFSQTSAGTWTTRADRVRVGSTTNSATTPPRLNAVIDNVRIQGAVANISTLPPPAPTGLTATSSTAIEVTLGWTDASSDEASFFVQRSVDNSTWTEITSALAPNTTTYVDKAVQPETQYSYRVLARNANGTSAPSASVMITTPGIPPLAPSGLVVSSVSGGVSSVSWVDNSDNESGFVLERSADSTFQTATTTVSVPAGTTTYQDSTGEGVAWYRVKSVTPVSFSTWSNTARGSRIKDMTFEGGSLIGTYGATKVATSSTVGLETASPLLGSTSARIPMSTTSAYLEENFPTTDELFLSFYMRPVSRGSVDVRLSQFLHGTGGTAVTAGALLLRANGAIQLRNYNTTIGTGPILALGSTYRLGLRQKRTGPDTMSLEAYLAVGDAPFGAPFASTTSTPLLTTTNAGTARVGATGNGGLDAVLDDIKLDTTYLPSPTGGSSP
jgi:hypothetical protein